MYLCMSGHTQGWMHTEKELNIGRADDTHKGIM